MALDIVAHRDTPLAPAPETGEARTRAAEPVRAGRAADRKFVTSLARGLHILGAFGPRDRWLTNQEIARRTGLARPTVTRLTYTLTQLGHLSYSASERKYGLGRGACELGLAALGQMPVRRLARPAMERLARDTGTAVHLAVCDGTSMVIVDACGASPEVEVGSRVPLATSSLGRAHLCALPELERWRLLDELRRSDPEGAAEARRALESAARDHAAHGFCLGLGEWRREVHGVAVPFLPGDEAEPVVFGCTGASFRFPEQAMVREIGPRLLAMVAEVAEALRAGARTTSGGRAPLLGAT